MFSLGLSSKKKQQFILFDIGSASVGVGVAVSSGNSTKVIWQKRLEYGYKYDQDYNRYVRTMYATLLEAGMKLVSEGFREAQSLDSSFSVKDSNVFCLLSPPWFMSTVQVETEKKEKPFQTSVDILNKLQAQGLSKVLQKKETKSWQDLMGTPVLLEAHHDRIRLEGYPVVNFEHRMVNEFSTECYYSIVSEPIQEHIQEVIERVLPNHEIFFSTSTRIFSPYCAKICKGKRRSVLLEIGGEITTIGIIDKGLLTSTKTVPLGLNHVLKSIAPKAQSANEAKGSFGVLCKNNTTMDFESFPEIARNTLIFWKENILKSLHVLSRGVTPPSNIFVVVDPSWFPIYKLALKTPLKIPEFKQNVDFKIHSVSQDMEENTKETSEDVRLSLYTRLLFSCTSKNSICYTGNNK